MIEAAFRHTSTIGMRERQVDRHTLERETVAEEKTPFGSIRKKVSRGYGVTRQKYEYDDLSAAAGERSVHRRTAGETGPLNPERERRCPWPVSARNKTPGAGAASGITGAAGMRRLTSGWSEFRPVF